MKRVLTVLALLGATAVPAAATPAGVITCSFAGTTDVLEVMGQPDMVTGVLAGASPSGDLTCGVRVDGVPRSLQQSDLLGQNTPPGVVAAFVAFLAPVGSDVSVCTEAPGYSGCEPAHWIDGTLVVAYPRVV